jgi:hypothetical protein
VSTVEVVEFTVDELFELCSCLSVQIANLTALRELNRLPKDCEPMLARLESARLKLATAGVFELVPEMERASIEAAKRRFQR